MSSDSNLQNSSIAYVAGRVDLSIDWLGTAGSQGIIFLNLPIQPSCDAQLNFSVFLIPFFSSSVHAH